VLNIVFPGAGIPVVMAALGIGTLWAGIASWRHNARAGLHAQRPVAPGAAQPSASAEPAPSAPNAGEPPTPDPPGAPGADAD
jgi:hypothetical protein